MFHVGQRVKLIVDNPCGNKRLFAGATGTLINVEDGLLVEFDEPCDGHGGAGRGKNGYCWWLSTSEFIPDDEEDEEIETAECTDDDIISLIFQEDK